MKLLSAIMFQMIVISTNSISAERDWAAFEKEIAEKTKAKNLTYKIKENKLKVQLSDRLKRLVKEMVETDIKEAEFEKKILEHGHKSLRSVD